MGSTSLSAHDASGRHRAARTPWADYDVALPVGWRGTAVASAIMAVAFYASARLGYALSVPGTNIGAFWPPAGLSVGLLVVLGSRAWPGIAAGAAAVILPDLLARLPLEQALTIGLGEVVADILPPLIGVEGARRAVEGTDPLQTSSALAWFLVWTGPIAQALAACLGVAALWLGGGLAGTTPLGAWVSWFVSNLASVALLSPLVLAWRRPRPLEHPLRHLLVLASAILVGLAVFFWIDPSTGAAVRYVSFLLVLWAAHWLGAAGTVSTAAVLSVIAVAAAIRGRPVFASGSPAEQVVLLSFYVGTLGITGAALAVLRAERREAVAWLRESERRLSRAISATAEAIWELKPATAETYYSPRWYEMLGYADRQLPMTLETWKSLCHPDDLPPALARLEAEIASPEGRGYRAEFRMRRSDGSWLWVLGRGRVVERDAAGRPLLVSGTHTDIGQGKLAEIERERLASAIEQAEEVVVITDTDGAIRYVNPAFERTGFTRAEALGRNPRILKSGRQGPEFYRELWGTITQGRTWKGRFINRRKDGSLFTEDAVISPVRDASGRIVSYVGVKRDVTRQLELEEDLRQAQKLEAIGRLAGGVVHDFNNVLSAIMCCGESLRYGARDSQPADIGVVEEIMAAADRARGITGHLLAFARRDFVEPVPLNVNGALGSARRMLERLLGENVTLTLALEPALWPIRFDHGQLDQVLLNLMANARDALPSGGRVEVSTANHTLPAAREEWPRLAPGAYVRLKVRDDGTGMTPEVAERAFLPFFTTKEVGRGTGLGLATVRGIVENNGGQIRLSSFPGQGTQVEILLPRSDAPPAELPSPGAAEPPGGTESLLVVDDDPLVRRAIERLLGNAGYRVLVAGDGMEALAIAHRLDAAPDLIVTDVAMPRLDGPALVEKLRERWPRLRAVFLSGYADDRLSSRVLQGGVDLVRKPLAREVLLQRVRAALDRRDPS